MDLTRKGIKMVKHIKLESCIKCGSRPMRMENKRDGWPSLYETKCRKCGIGVRRATQKLADAQWNAENTKEAL